MSTISIKNQASQPHTERKQNKNPNQSDITIMLTGEPAAVVDHVSKIFGQSHNEFVDTFLDRFLGSKLHPLCLSLTLRSRRC